MLFVIGNNLTVNFESLYFYKMLIYDLGLKSVIFT